MSDRTFKVVNPHMVGEDVSSWEETLNAAMRTWSVDYSVPIDGDYSVADRDLTATVLHGLGIDTARMVQGVTPALRTKVRNRRLSVGELARFRARAGWRKRLRERHRRRQVAPPLLKVLADSWGWHPGVHDGVDLICPPSAILHAICDAKVIDVRGSGWWGLGAPADPALRAKGDGIIQLECLIDAGPFRRGLHFAYGHAEHATVKVGERVEAGQVIGRAGLANAWHVHFMVNGGLTTQGRGDRDPRPFLDYARRA